jgi:hypothetical protein
LKTALGLAHNVKTLINRLNQSFPISLNFWDSC